MKQAMFTALAAGTKPCHMATTSIILWTAICTIRTMTIVITTVRLSSLES